MKTNTERKAYVSIKLSGSRNILVKTHNNMLSDVGCDTLIQHDSRLYNGISELSIGDQVWFSGEFIPSERDHLFEISLTERGAMLDPAFVMRFSDISTLPTEAPDQVPKAVRNHDERIPPAKPKSTILGAKRHSEPTTRTITKEEFRRHILRLLGGVPAGEVAEETLYKAFGRPHRTATISGESRWYWQCSDGTMVLVNIAPFDTPGVRFITEINDF